MMSNLAFILFVEDDETIRMAVEMALTDEGYPLVMAKHGAAALEIVAQRQPALILLDMRMPVMDGPAFLTAYRQTPQPHAPIVAMSASRNMVPEPVMIDVDDVI